jgi:two-component system, LytTR family, sensor kinase
MALFYSIHHGTMRKIWLGVIISTFVGIAFFFYLYYSETGIFPNVKEHWVFFALGILIANIIGLVLHLSDHLLNKWISWNKNLSGRLILGLFVNNVLALGIITLFGWLILSQLNSASTFTGLWADYSDIIAKTYIITVIAIVIYSVIYFALYSYNQYTVVHLEGAKNQRRQLILQFEALKSQLSPHYLFNSLNTISSLVFKDAFLAEDFIRRLASSYQYILRNNEKQFVTLEDEVEFVKSYNYLLQVRFENNLKLEINLPPNIMDSKIPPLTLQMLVENAVKHNIITKDKPLNIYISAIDNTDIRIINTKTEAPQKIKSFHVGLDNIKERYRFFTDRKIKIEDNNSYTVLLPVIKNNQAKSA